MNQIKGVIFDVDGTLVDSNDQHAKAFEEAFHSLGFSIAFAKIRPLIGMGSDKLIPQLTDLRRGDKMFEKISETKSAIFKQRYVSTLRMFPGVSELVDKLKNLNFKLAIASSASRIDLKMLLGVTGLESQFDAILSSDDAISSKPDADLVLAAANRLNLAPDELVMIGDTPYDLLAAARSGVRGLGFRCGGWEDFALNRAQEIYDGPWDLVDRFGDSDLLGRNSGELHVA